MPKNNRLQPRHLPREWPAGLMPTCVGLKETMTSSPNASNLPAPSPDGSAELGFRMPPALVIVSFIVLLAMVATLVLPRGEYERQERTFQSYELVLWPQGMYEAAFRSEHGLTDDAPLLNEHGEATATPGQWVRVPAGMALQRTAVIPGTYPVEGTTQRGPIDEEAVTSAGNAALSPVMGFIDKADIIGFVLLIGGSFGVMLSTGAVDQFLGWSVAGIGNSRFKWLAIVVSMTLFSLGGSIYGMGEGTIAFVLITVPLALRLGYDTVTGICMCYLASQVGFAGAFLNPFTLGIAQAIAELPYLSGNGLRYTMWVVVTGFAIAFVLRHATRVHADPTRSPTYELDQSLRATLHMDAAAEAMTRRPSLRQSLVMLLVLGSVLMAGLGVVLFDWYINEMAAMFLVVGVASGLIAGMSPTKIANEFVEGTKLMIEPALIIALSAGIVFVLTEGRVLDTILYALATPLEIIGPAVGSVLLMVLHTIINFFVPSGSGAAAMTIPITAPLCDLIGLDRQVGVLAFQFGDGFGNMVIPTSAVLMGVLGVTRVPWWTWVRWVLPLIIWLHVIGAVILLVAVYGPQEWLQ